MPPIPDNELESYIENAKDKVVLITGGSRGIGKSAALRFANGGAKIVIGDIDEKTAKETAAQIEAGGHHCVSQKCDVRDWDQQLSLFQFAITTYGRIDYVIANAGITEKGDFDPVSVASVPRPPNTATAQVNLFGALYTAHLALFYLVRNPNPHKALVLIGSMASLSGIPMAPMYTVSKHAVLGLMRSLAKTVPQDIKVTMIAPWFADTKILGSTVRLVLAGVPMADVNRIAGSIILAATDPSRDTNGSVYTIPDDGEVYRVDMKDAELTTGIYSIMQKRLTGLLENRGRIQHTLLTLKDVLSVLGLRTVLLGVSPLLALCLYRYIL